MKEPIFGTDADTPPYRYVGLTPEGHIQIEKVRENWHVYKEEGGYKYWRCESNGKTWYDRESLSTGKRLPNIQ